MKKIDNNTFVKKYQCAVTDEEKHLLLKNHMLSMSFEELMDWQIFLSDNIDLQIQKNIKDGLTNEDKEFYRQQFARFDSLLGQGQAKVAVQNNRWHKVFSRKPLQGCSNTPQ